MDDYADFLTHLNEITLKQKKLLEKVTILHNEISIALLETASVYDPQVLVDLIEITVNSSKFDKHVSDIKSQLEKVLTRPKNITEEYESLEQELHTIQNSLKSNFNFDTKVFQ